MALGGITALAGRPFLACDHNGGKVCVVGEDGTIQREFQCRSPQDCWRLPNGNLLFCYATGSREVDAEGRTTWEYRAPEKVEVHSCQPLPDGRVLVLECGTSRLIEVDRQGSIVKTIPSIPTRRCRYTISFEAHERRPKVTISFASKAKAKLSNWIPRGRSCERFRFPVIPMKLCRCPMDIY